MLPRLLVALLVGIAMLAQPVRAYPSPVEAVLPVKAKMPLSVGKRYLFTFSLFDQASGGSALWQEVKKYRVPADKTIRHQLGSVEPVINPLPVVEFAKQLWVEVTGGGKTKRFKLSAAPYGLGSAAAPPTGTQFAHASYTSSGTRYGSDNIACTWDGSLGATINRWTCLLSSDGAPVNFSTTTFVVQVTPTNASTPRMAVVNSVYLNSINQIVVRIFDIDGISLQAAFSIVVFSM